MKKIITAIVVAGFLIYWDCASFADGNYVNILFSIPFWLGGIYYIYKRLFKRK